MQLVFLPPWGAVLVYACMWFMFQAGAAWLCFRMDNEKFAHDHSIYRIRAWEDDGRLYNKLFSVHRWKKYLPDGGAFFAGGYSKKHLTVFSQENLAQYVVESRRAELTHWLAIFPFWVFGFIGPANVLWIMLLYALIVNLPCIIAQRYNRPRFQKLLAQMKMNASPEQK